MSALLLFESPPRHSAEAFADEAKHRLASIISAHIAAFGTVNELQVGVLEGNCLVHLSRAFGTTFGQCAWQVECVVKALRNGTAERNTTPGAYALPHAVSKAGNVKNILLFVSAKWSRSLDEQVLKAILAKFDGLHTEIIALVDDLNNEFALPSSIVLLQAEFALSVSVSTETPMQMAMRMVAKKIVSRAQIKMGSSSIEC